MSRAAAATMLAVAIGLAAALPARATVVSQLDVAVRDFHPSYHGYTTQLDGRVYDTTGIATPPLSRADIYVPRGAKAHEYELAGTELCNNAVLALTADPSVCRPSQIGTGTLTLLASTGESVVTPVYLFINGPSADEAAKGARGMIVTFLPATSLSAAQTLYGAAYPASGLYSYRISVPAVVAASNPAIRLSIMEFHLTIPGIVIAAPTKKRPRHKLFWTTLPRCAKTGNVYFEVRFQFADATSIGSQRAVKCPRFLRR